MAAAVLLVFEHLPAEQLALPVRRAAARGAARQLARLAHRREPVEARSVLAMPEAVAS